MLKVSDVTGVDDTGIEVCLVEESRFNVAVFDVVALDV